MNRLNLLFTLSSINVVLVSIERFSPTTNVILQPYNFLRLHEVLQISTLILFTVLIPFFLLKELTHNFEDLKSKKGTILAALFIAGIYFYATGNGIHELGSYLFNSFCNTKQIESVICGSTFFNDYYFGNILYFIGGFLMIIPLLIFEKTRPTFKFSKKDNLIMIINSLIYSLAIFAYSAFDRVLVGLIYSGIIMIVANYFILTKKQPFSKLPFITSTALSYTVGTLASLFVRFFR